MEKAKRMRMLGVSAGSTYCTMASAIGTGRSTFRILHVASMETPIPETRKMLPKRIAPLPKNFSSSSCPLSGMLASGASFGRAASATAESDWDSPAARSTESSLSDREAPGSDTGAENDAVGTDGRDGGSSIIGWSSCNAAAFAAFDGPFFLREGFFFFAISTGATARRCVRPTAASRRCGTNPLPSADSARSSARLRCALPIVRDAKARGKVRVLN